MVLFNEYSKNYVKNEFIEQKCINEDNSFKKIEGSVSENELRNFFCKYDKSF